MLKLRNVNINDAEILLLWRNDPETRSASYTGHEIQKKEHLLWLERTINNPNIRLFIAEENNVPVGVIRSDCDLSTGSEKLSWTVAPDARMKGIGKQMVVRFASQIKNPIVAEIKAGNIASIKIAEYAGMKLCRTLNNIFYYERSNLG